MARSTSSPVAAPGPAVDAGPGRSLALNLLISLRPAQWTKNLFVFAGLLFGRKLLDPAAIVDAVGAFVVFCVLSGVVYLVNDHWYYREGPRWVYYRSEPPVLYQRRTVVHSQPTVVRERAEVHRAPPAPHRYMSAPPAPRRYESAPPSRTAPPAHVERHEYRVE